MAQRDQKEVNELKDLLEKTLIAVRDSASPSLSQVIRELHKSVDEIGRKLDTHIEIHETDIKNINKKLDPVVSVYQGANVFGYVTRKIAAIMLSSYAIAMAYKHLFK